MPFLKQAIQRIEAQGVVIFRIDCQCRRCVMVPRQSFYQRDAKMTCKCGLVYDGQGWLQEKESETNP